MKCAGCHQCCVLLLATISHYFLCSLHRMFNPTSPSHRRNFPGRVGFAHWTKFQHAENGYFGILFVPTENIFGGHQHASSQLLFHLVMQLKWCYSTQMSLWYGFASLQLKRSAETFQTNHVVIFCLKPGTKRVSKLKHDTVTLESVSICHLHSGICTFLYALEYIGLRIPRTP